MSLMGVKGFGTRVFKDDFKDAQYTHPTKFHDVKIVTLIGVT